MGESRLQKCSLWLEFRKNKWNWHALRLKYIYLSCLWCYLFLTSHTRILNLERMSEIIQSWASPFREWVSLRINLSARAPLSEEPYTHMHTHTHNRLKYILGIECKTCIEFLKQLHMNFSFVIVGLAWCLGEGRTDTAIYIMGSASWEESNSVTLQMRKMSSNEAHWYFLYA